MSELPSPASPSTCAIAVMAKASIPGRTKSRLISPLSADEAAGLNTAFLQDAADRMLAAAALAAIDGYMAYAPAGSEAFFKQILPAGIGLLETVAPDLGACLTQAAATLLGRGYGSICLLNSDSPTLPVGYLVAAATILAAPGDRVVLGPSTDGGYYLIGLKQPHGGLFQGIAWSTPQVYAQTVQRAAALGLPLVTLPTWYDVDDAAALRTLIGELFAERPFRVVGTAPTRAASTRAYLSALHEKSDLARRLQ